MSKYAITSFDRVWEEDECPKCLTRRLTAPNLELYYAACCGSPLCRDCYMDTFRLNKASSIKCDACGKDLTKSQFNRKLFGQQLLEKCRQVRKRFNDTLNILELTDFSGDIDKFNAHLEFVEDVMFRLTAEPVVTSELTAEVNNEVQRYMLENREAFSLAQKRRSEEKYRAIRAKAASDAANDENASEQINQQPIVMPPPMIAQKTQPSVIERLKTPDVKMMSPKTLTNYKRKMMLKPLVCKQAGGFLAKYDKERVEQDTYQTLFIFE